MNFTHKSLQESGVRPNSIHASENKSISVLLIEEDKSNKSILKKALIDCNYHVTKYLSFDDNFIAQIELCNPDILILTTEQPNENLLKNLAEVNRISPLPVIIFASDDSPNIIQSVIKSGVSAYVVHEVFPKSIRGIISIAIERFKERQLLRNELKQAKTQLESRKLIERAKGHIMQLKQINENKAYGALRKMAMDQGSPIEVVAKNIIDVYELIATPNI
jgi:response regulator NasT